MKFSTTLRLQDSKQELTGKTIRQTYISGTTADCKERTRVTRDVEGVIELTIDEQAIMRRLGGLALLSKCGRAQAMRGLVKAKRISSKELSKTVEPPRALTGSEVYL
jgi:hypothetical protein